MNDFVLHFYRFRIHRVHISFSDDFGPPCRSICPDFVPFPHINTSCTLFGRHASFIQPKTGTVCKSLCHRGYGFTPDSAHSQTCLDNGRWNHRNLDCVKENQFVIFLLRTSSATDKMHICLISDENGNVKKVDHTVCLNGMIDLTLLLNQITINESFFEFQSKMVSSIFF